MEINDINKREDCFFCAPDASRVIAQSDNFYAVLGLGPIVEGYTIIASKLHYKSTLDLPEALLHEQVNFKNEVRALLKKLYGDSIVVEHGRIEACTSQVAHENHCFHAHQLIFPVNVDLSPLIKDYKYDPVKYDSIFKAQEKINPFSEYLFFENSKNETYIALATHPCRRQFLRYLVGITQQREDRADWTKFEGWDDINKAKLKINDLKLNPSELTHSL